MTYNDIINAVETLKTELVEEVNEIDFSIEGVTNLGHNCMSVPFSLLASGGSWDPSFYNSQIQKNKLLQEIERSTSLESIVKKLNKVCDKGTFSDGTRANPQFVKCVNDILEKKGCRVCI